MKCSFCGLTYQKYDSYRMTHIAGSYKGSMLFAQTVICQLMTIRRTVFQTRDEMTTETETDEEQVPRGVTCYMLHVYC